MQTADAIATDLQDKVRLMTDSLDRNLKVAWSAIARMTGLTAGQIKRLYYGEWRIVPAHVFVRITEAYRAHLTRVAERKAHEAAVYQALVTEWDQKWPNG